MSYISPTPVQADPADALLATPVDPFWLHQANRSNYPPVHRLFRLLALASPKDRADAIDQITDHCRQRLGSEAMDAILNGRTA
ncbi:hypothetical protein J2848_005658 [Azospirillum lipoferum]|uniref:Uncharacterized protein n=1 Tax=Azospirillum lipoferum TaxID=193 RepID=A0A5A9GF40_AZOLI|nr:MULTISPECIES: hypothetical protein [Azospirillum]KAA0592983.1 hypothetical protein FZ942_26015 [Azospirillum lipoferum]MCP1613957.1 hypothetical protein [Azospirillum lipoferum]MDW5537649.1 hypothetical protein [Azospirillum sp. NL1]